MSTTSIEKMRISEEMHVAFLRRPCKTRLEYLNKMTASERILFTELTTIKKKTDIRNIVRCPQRTTEWYRARSGRITASISGASVGLGSKRTPVLCQARDSIYKPFESNPMTIWGTNNESNAGFDYICDLRRSIHKTYEEQRDFIASGSTLSGFIEFKYRGQSIPVLNKNELPTVELFLFGFMTDPYNQWRGMSPDGVVVVNGVAIGCVEIKCPFGTPIKRGSGGGMEGDHALYVNIPKYYYPQIQSELYLCQLIWPTVQWIDFIAWSPEHWTLETFLFDAPFFFDWYAKREMRYYFEAYLPMLAKQARADFVEKSKTFSKPTTAAAEKQLEESFRKFIQTEFIVPSQRNKQEGS